MTPVMAWQWRQAPFSYRFQGEDVLSLARAVEFEGRPQDAVMWCLLQRFAMLYSIERGLDLSSFLVRTIDDLNPRWFVDGDLFLERTESLLKQGKLAEMSFERRKAQARPIKASRPWSMISARTRDLVNNTLKGATINMCPGAVQCWESRATHTMTMIEARAHNQARRPELMIMDIGAGFGPGVHVFFASANSNHLSNLTLSLGEP